MLKTVAQSGGTTGALNYQGTWNASTNTPTLTSSVGTKGYYYVVSVAGTTNLDGITDWQVNDWAVFNGSIWQKVDNTDGVVSVNGKTGVVVLGPTDVGATPNTANVIAGTGLSGGGVLTGNVTINLANTAVTAGTYGGGTNAFQAVVDAQGRITSATNVAIPQGTVTSITAGTGLSGGTITTSGTIALANTAVAAGSYGTANTVSQVTIDAQGRITSAANVAISIANSAVSGLGTMSTQNASAVAITGGNVVANVTVLNATNATATYQTSSLPLVPAGYVQIQLANATVVKIPYYAA